MVPLLAAVLVAASVPVPLFDQPLFAPASKFGLPTRLCPSGMVMVTSSRNRLGCAVGVPAAVWFRYSIADRTTPGVAAPGWQSAYCVRSTVPVTFVHTPWVIVKPYIPTVGKWLAAVAP